MNRKAAMKTTLKELADVLRLAADLVTRGWVKDHHYAVAIREGAVSEFYCASGAVFQAACELRFRAGPFQALKAVDTWFGERVEIWNARQTKQSVIDGLLDAAAHMEAGR